MEWSTLGLPVHHQLPEFAQTHVHWVSDAIQSSHPLFSPYLPIQQPFPYVTDNTRDRVQFSLVAQWCPTLCSTPGSPFLHYLLEFAQIHVHWISETSNHLILFHPLLLPSLFPSIRVFSSESVLLIRWPKYWSFSFSISPSNEYSGLIFFKTDWFDLLAVQGTLKSLLQHHSLKA